MAYCVECGHLLFASSRGMVETLFWTHVRTAHPHRSRHKLTPITAERYRDHQLMKGNPRYWQALINGVHTRPSG